MASLVTESRVDGTVVAGPHPPRPAELFPWVVFTLTFALLLSDYMSRQVLSASTAPTTCPPTRPRAWPPSPSSSWASA